MEWLMNCIFCNKKTAEMQVVIGQFVLKKKKETQY